MKKNGFTLAEVLITLTIIGVIATMTLPALMTNTQEQQAKTALKKGINTLTEAAQLSQAIDGIDYASLTTNGTTSVDPIGNPSLYALLRTRTQVDPANSGTGKHIFNGASSASGNYTMFFRDGTALMFDNTKAMSTATSGKKAASEVMNDGLPYGIAAVFDTNGKKGPNLLSNCDGKLNAIATEPTAAGRDSESKRLDEVCTKENRVIKDQFAVRLRAGYAVPNSPAARWAFEN